MLRSITKALIETSVPVGVGVFISVLWCQGLAKSVRRRVRSLRAA